MLAAGKKLTSAEVRAMSPDERRAYIREKWAPAGKAVSNYANAIVGAAKYADQLEAEKPLQLGRKLSIGEMQQALRNPGLKLEDPQGKLGMAFRDLGRVGGPLNPYRVAAQAMGHLMMTESLQRAAATGKIEMIEVVGKGAVTGAEVGTAIGSLVAGAAGGGAAIGGATTGLPGAVLGGLIGAGVGTVVGFLIVANGD